MVFAGAVDTGLDELLADTAAVQLVRDTFGAALDDGADPEVLPLYETELLSVEGALGVGYTF